MDYSVRPQLKCVLCHYPESTILSRRVNSEGISYDTLSEYLIENLPASFIGPRQLTEHKCDSCMMYERGVAGSHIRCVGCGLAETLSLLYNPEDRFYVGNSSWPPTYWCKECPKPLDIVMDELEDEFEVESDEDEPELMECTLCGRFWDGNAQCNCFYNDDSDGEEDNEEVSVTRVKNKKDLSEIAEILFEYKEKFKEIDYCRLMDLMKKLHDKQN